MGLNDVLHGGEQPPLRSMFLERIFGRQRGQAVQHTADAVKKHVIPKVDVYSIAKNCGEDPKKCGKDIWEFTKGMGQAALATFDKDKECFDDTNPKYVGLAKCQAAKAEATKEWVENGGVQNAPKWIFDKAQWAAMNIHKLRFSSIHDFYNWLHDSCDQSPEMMWLKFKLRKATIGPHFKKKVAYLVATGQAKDVADAAKIIAQKFAKGLLCFQEKKEACTKKGYYFEGQRARCNMKCPSDSQGRDQEGRCNCGPGRGKCPSDYPHCVNGVCVENKEAYECSKKQGYWYSLGDKACKMGCPSEGQGRDGNHSCACGPGRGMCPKDYPNCDASGHCVPASQGGTPYDAAAMVVLEKACTEKGKYWWDNKGHICNMQCPNDYKGRNTEGKCNCDSGADCPSGYMCKDGVCEAPGDCPDGWTLTAVQNGAKVCNCDGSGYNGPCGCTSGWPRGANTQKWASDCGVTWTNTKALSVGERAPTPAVRCWNGKPCPGQIPNCKDGVCVKDSEGGHTHNKAACDRKRDYWWEAGGNSKCNMQCPSNQPRRGPENRCECGPGRECPEGYPFCRGGVCTEGGSSGLLMNKAVCERTQHYWWESGSSAKCNMGCPRNPHSRNAEGACHCSGQADCPSGYTCRNGVCSK